MLVFKELIDYLSKQKELDADSRAIQQIIFTGKASANVVIYYILEKIKRNNIRIFKRNNKSFVINIKWLNIIK